MTQVTLEPTDVLTIDGVRTPLYDAGPSRDEAVVFVHGNPGPMDDWSTLAAAVSPFARVLAMDMPAFGRADRPREFDFSPRGYARHLGALLDRLAIRRVHLVLHDFGGSWGLHWAKQHPAAVRSLTLINTGVLRGYHWHFFARVWQTAGVGEVFQLFAGRRSITAVMNRDNPRPFPRHFTERVTGYADMAQKLSVMRLYRAAKDPSDAFPDPGLDVPACVVWGAADRYMPVAHAEAQRQFFPQAEVHVLPGLGHWPFIDDADAVAAHVVPFLRRVTYDAKSSSL